MSQKLYPYYSLYHSETTLSQTINLKIKGISISHDSRVAITVTVPDVYPTKNCQLGSTAQIHLWNIFRHNHHLISIRQLLAPTCSKPPTNDERMLWEARYEDRTHLYGMKVEADS